jgi:hypothetical protein
VIANHPIDRIGRQGFDWFAIQGDFGGHRNNQSQSTEQREGK